MDQKGLIKKKYYIKVTKNIPQKSGMGGGSMNAASILKFFLKRKIVILNKKRILEVCEMVGNDVKIGLYKGPIFLNSKQSLKIAFTAIFKFFLFSLKYLNGLVFSMEGL